MQTLRFGRQTALSFIAGKPRSHRDRIPPVGVRLAHDGAGAVTTGVADNKKPAEAGFSYDHPDILSVAVHAMVDHP
jgi:hypothetical protein